MKKNIYRITPTAAKVALAFSAGVSTGAAIVVLVTEFFPSRKKSAKNQKKP